MRRQSVYLLPNIAYKKTLSCFVKCKKKKNKLALPDLLAAAIKVANITNFLLTYCITIWHLSKLLSLHARKAVSTKSITELIYAGIA